MCVAVDIRRCDESMPSPSAAHQITSSPSKVRSGNSANVIRAVQKARQKQMVTVALTGQSGGKLAHLVDFAFKVPSTDTPRIQEAHILIGHIICEIVESKLFA